MIEAYQGLSEKRFDMPDPDDFAEGDVQVLWLVVWDVEHF
jgi:hypothetical protein